MKYKYIILIFALMFLILNVNMAFAEMQLWNNVIVDRTNNVVKDHAFYTFEDTSASGVGKNKDVPINIKYDIVALPYNMSPYLNTVEDCNVTMIHYANLYDSQGNLYNTSTEIQSAYFANTSQTNGYFTFNLRSRDSITADIKCTYANNNSLYVENFLAGRLTTVMPSYECNGCSSYTLEQQSDAVKNADNVTATQLSMYNTVQNVVTFNYKIWLILFWVICLSFIFLALGLLFSILWYFYKYMESLLK